MKFLTLFFLFIIGSLTAQSPLKFNYQAVARDNTGAIMNSKLLGVRLSIHDGSSNGAVQYSETFSVTTNQFGLFTVNIGTGSPFTGSFTDVTWNSGSKFLQVEMDPSGGTSYLNMGTDQLQSVPYALFSQTANSINGGLSLKSLRNDGASNGQVLKWNSNTNQWEPGTDNQGTAGQTYTAGNGISITAGNVINNTGDLDASDDITNSTNAGGDLSGKYPNPTIADNTINSAKIINGSIMAIDMANGVIPISLPPNGIAGGDLSGTYPNPTLNKIQGKPLSASNPATGEVLKWNGSQWNPDSDLLTLPATINGNSTRLQSIPRFLLELTQSGSDGVLSLVDANSTSNNSALYSESNGLAIAGQFNNKGSGKALLAEINNLNSTASVLSLVTQGKGSIITAENFNQTNSASLFKANVNGTGMGIDLSMNLVPSTSPAISVNSASLGRGLFINRDNNNSSLPAMDIQTNGNGSAGKFLQSSTTAANSDALYVEARAVNWGLHVVNTNSAGIAGKIENTNTNSINDALQLINAGTGFALRCTGNALKTTGGNTWAVPSDIRLKKDIKEFKDGLSVLEKIIPKRFRYNGLAGTNDRNEEIGVIAQEMQKIAPYTVEARMTKLHPENVKNTDKDDSIELLSFNSGALQYVTINAVKELSEMVKSLKSENEQMKKDISDLKGMINSNNHSQQVSKVLSK